MKTFPLLAAFLLLGFASTGMATWDWSLGNIANFKTEITVSEEIGNLVILVKISFDIFLHHRVT